MKLPTAHNITHTVVTCLLFIECNIVVHHDHDVVIGDTMIVEDLIGVAHISLVGGQGLEVKNQSDILCGWVHLVEGLVRRSKSLMMWIKKSLYGNKHLACICNYTLYWSLLGFYWFSFLHAKIKGVWFLLLDNIHANTPSHQHNAPKKQFSQNSLYHQH